MTGAEVLFWLFALLTCFGAIAVVVSQNVVRMAFWLVVALGSTAGLFFMLDADFVGATQLLIYVGGTVVLLIFGVMLTASGPYVRIRTSPADGFLAAGVGVLFLAMIVATVAAVDWNGASLKLTEVPARRFAQVMGDTDVSHSDADLVREWYVPAAQEAGSPYLLRRDRELTSGTAAELTRIWTRTAEDEPREASAVRSLGLAFLGIRPDRDLGAATDRKLSAGYLLPFEIISIHLLVVLVGAAYLARAKRRVQPSGNP